MNEITKIHLGRQAFTIAVDAHKALQSYLQAIKKQVVDKEDVVEEVELRMAELLSEKGIGGDKVVLLQDVDYLKQQLGEPGDFGEGDSDKSSDDSSSPKRLFRDTENGMLAGVCAGIAKYFNIDAVWVRLAFVALLFAGASSILLYIVLWLIVPEAKTKSERLQMQGKPVTVDTIKGVVERADVEGAALRARKTTGRMVKTILKVLAAVIGSALVTTGTVALMGLIAGSVYLSLNHDVLVPFDIFPVGVGESVLVGSVLLAAAMVALFLLFAGIAMARRKWVVPGWGIGAMVAVFLACLAVGAALTADAVPKVRDRVEAAHHSDVRVVKQPFTKVNVINDDNSSRLTEVVRRNSDQYKIEIRYLGNADTSGVTVKELKDGELEVNTQAFKSDPRCKTPCIFTDRDMQIFVYAPVGQPLVITGSGTAWFYNDMPIYDETTTEPFYNYR